MKLTRHRLHVLILSAAAAITLSLVSTAEAAPRYAVASNTWSTTATWSAASCAGASGASVPVAADDVTICPTRTVTLDTNATAQNITINSTGTLRLGNNNTARTLTIRANLTINGGGTLDVDTASNTTHTLVMSGAAGTGNLVNDGTLNLASDANSLCDTTFSFNGNQTVSGAGSNIFNRITLNMGASRANILDMQSLITEPAGFLTITNGTYKHSSASAIVPWTANPNIPANGGFWLDGTATVTTTGFDITVNGGLFRISAGTMSIGNASGTRLILNNAATTLFQMDGGALTVSGGINSSANNAAGTFTMSGGTITLMTVSAGAVYTVLLGSATTFNMSGGTIIAVNGNNTTDDVDIRSATQNVTGGTLQMGSSATTSANDISMINGAGGQFNIWNLVIGAGIAKTILMRSTTNILNDLTIQTLNNLAPSAGIAINIGAGNVSGNWTNNGTFTQSTTTVMFTGTSNTQFIGGTTATTFNNLTINKASNNLTINTTPTVNATLTFTNGKIATGANRVILGTAATIATPSANSYVIGTLQKNYNAAAALTFATNEFAVGDATNYTPVDITAGTTSTAGSLSVTTTASDHPQITTPIASTAIDATKSVNRYWTMNNSGLTLSAPISAGFTFVAGDVDGGANTANFIVERYDGTNWSPTTLTAANPLNTQASNITPLAAGNNDFAIGETVSGMTVIPGRFNAFETVTPANSLRGRVYTKLANVAFGLDVISLNAGKTAYGGAVANVTVQLLDSSNNTGALDVNGCRSTWTVAQTITSTLNIPASGRITLGGITATQAYRDARLRISSAGPLIGCSSDRFAIRPQSFSITSSTATQTNSSGAPAIKTGANFDLTATSVAGYNGTPTLDNTKVVGTPNAGAIGGVFGVAAILTGTATGANFFYSEVGNFGLNSNAVFDSTFANVDQSNDCTTGFSNTLVGGKYSCSFGSSAVAQTTGSSGFGRFIPDNFNVSYNAPTFGTTCGTFSYIGAAFTYTTQPVMTVTARNGTANGLSNATTTNYAGTYMKLTNTSLTPATQAARYTRFDALGGGNTPALDTAGLPVTTGDPAIGAFTNGVGALTFAPGIGLTFFRNTTTPSAPFNADIGLTLNVVDTDGVAFAGNPASFGTATAGNGIAFSGGKPMRYGRLRLSNAHGSELLDLPIPIEAQYWNGTVFAVNTLDNCTTLTPANVALANYKKGLNATNMDSTHIILGGAFAIGKGSLKLTKPTPAAAGSVDIAINLGIASPDQSCLTWAPIVPTSTGADKSYLRGKWCGASYDRDPSGRITFGVYKNTNQFIYMREMY